MEGCAISDAHVGSASSLIACKKLGFEFIGFEISQVYYDLAIKRMQKYFVPKKLF